MISDDVKAKLTEACSTVKCGCALERLAALIGCHDDLGIVGSRIGLTPYECEGVMDGWDVGSKRYRESFNGIFHRSYYPRPFEEEYAHGVGHELEYEAGRALGMELVHLYGTVPT